MSALGNNVIAMFGKRPAKETAPSDWVRMWARSFSLKANYEKAKDESLTGSRIDEPGFIAGVAYTGEISETLNKSSLALLEAGGFDKIEDATKITYTLSKEVSNWFDFVKFHTDNKLKEKFEKCRINSITFDIVNKAFIGVTWGIEGLEGLRTLNSSLTENPTGYVLSERIKSLDTVIKINGVNKSAIIKSMTLAINNNLDADNYGFGSIYRQDIDVSDVLTIELDATFSFDVTEYDGQLANLENNSVVPIEITLGTIVVKLAALSLSDVSAPASSKGKIELSIKGTCHNNGATEAIIIEHAI